MQTNSASTDSFGAGAILDGATMLTVKARSRYGRSLAAILVAVRVLGRYVRDRKTPTWEETARKMTSLPAETFGLAGRGRVVAGADLALIDAGAVADDSDFQDPVRQPRGIVHVLQGGAAAVRDGRYLGVRQEHRLRQGDE